MKALANRFKEPSTWAGLAVLAAMFGVPAEHINAVSQAGIGVFSALAVFLPEGK